VTIIGWRKSSFSYNGSSCLEAGNWRKSSRSVNNGACCEASSCHCGVGVRDSTDKSGPVLTFAAEAWADFLARTRAGTGVAH
jgi:hypothetical protein